MKTKNLGLTLLAPQQINKEIAINESLLTLDSLTAGSVKGFVSSAPANEYEAKFIINGGEKHQQICYNSIPSKGWQYLIPNKGMIFYVQQEKKFFCFDGTNWEPIVVTNLPMGSEVNNSVNSRLSQSTTDNTNSKPDIVSDGTRFTGISKYYHLPSDKCYHYLFVCSDTKIDIRDLKITTIHIIIKQNHQQVFNVAFVGNVLWNNDTAYRITRVSNTIDYIRLHKIPESPHFLGEIVGRGFKH